MIIAEPNIFGAGVAPFECNAELVVHADRPFTRSIALKPVKAMTGRNTQVLNRDGRIQPLEPAARGLDQIRRKALAWTLAEKDRPRLLAFPTLDGHAESSRRSDGA